MQQSALQLVSAANIPSAPVLPVTCCPTICPLLPVCQPPCLPSLPACLQNEADAYRNIKLRVEDVQGRNCLTNFWVRRGSGEAALG